MAITGIGVTLCTLAFGQGRPSGRPSGVPNGPPAFVTDLPERFAVLVLADTNSDKKLDEGEVKELAGAIADGVLKRPEGLPNPPDGVEISPEAVAVKLARFYESFAPYDVNNNGELEDEEKNFIREAIVDGKLKPPFLLIRGEGVRKGGGQDRAWRSRRGRPDARR